MCADVAGPRRLHRAHSTRALDYLYDSAYIVSGARDYARTAFKAAMGTAQLTLQPVYNTMFTDLRTQIRLKPVIHPNCRLPQHMDTSYDHYVYRVTEMVRQPAPQMNGKDLYKYITQPKRVLHMQKTTPDFHPPSPRLPSPTGKPKNKGTQSIFRESSAQTKPWQPDGKPADTCVDVPEVLYLDKLVWGPGKPYRTGDLPADFHTTEIINKMRHARIWTEVVDRAKFPRWMKKRSEIISDVEMKDWLFRQAEIDELQSIRLDILHRLQNERRDQQTTRTSKKLQKIWELKKKDLTRKAEKIHRSRDREIRKLTNTHSSGGRIGLVQRLRASRGMGNPSLAASDPTSDVFAPVARHGYQARNRHLTIDYNPDFLLMEDHEALGEPPPWLESCAHDLTKTCSGHAIPHEGMTLCERETKWSENFLEKLHVDLKRVRLGAAAFGISPLYVLKHRNIAPPARPKTPQLEAVPDEDESNHQMVLHLQRIIRGRAVQYLMYEGRTRAAELTEELKTTHGLQKEDKIRIAKEEAKARDYNALRTESEKREDAITALVDELCGGAVSAALDFLEKELRRLKEERRQHAFIMIALREKQMREAAEAGRRQKEEHRRREHDEMFKQVLGVTQDTVESYLQDIIREGVELGAEEEAVRSIEKQADLVEDQLKDQEGMSTAEQNELVAELVQQFLLPHTHKAAAQKHIQDVQKARLEAARKVIFGLLDDAEIKEGLCTRCGLQIGEGCRCETCPVRQLPVPTVSRDDPRWLKAKKRPVPVPKTPGERFPLEHEFRCMLNTLVDEVVETARAQAMNRELIRRQCLDELRGRVEGELEARDLVEVAMDLATGALKLPVKELSYHHFSRYVRTDAQERTVKKHKPVCPKELPSVIRKHKEEKMLQRLGTACYCVTAPDEKTKKITIIGPDPLQPLLLPSELRALEELRRCKCDRTPDGEDSDADDPFAEAMGPISVTDEPDSELPVALEGTEAEGLIEEEEGLQ